MADPIFEEEESGTASAAESPAPEQSLSNSMGPSGPWIDPFPNVSTQELEVKAKSAEVRSQKTY